MGPQQIEQPSGDVSSAPQPSQPASQLVAPKIVNVGGDAAVTGMILAFFIPIAGVIFSLLGIQKSKKAGQKNRLAVAGLVISLVITVGSLVLVGLGIVTLTNVSQKCSELGAGTHYLDSTTKIQCE